MIWVLAAMVAILVLAAVVMVYVAFPRRGEQVPRVPWVGSAMKKGVEKLPTVDNQRGQGSRR